MIYRVTIAEGEGKLDKTIFAEHMPRLLYVVIKCFLYRVWVANLNGLVPFFHRKTVQLYYELRTDGVFESAHLQTQAHSSRRRSRHITR